MSKRTRTVRVVVGDADVTVRLRPDGRPLDLLPSSWLFFSNTERRVLRLLLSKRALSREEIALALDESVDGRLRGVLASLVNRQIVLIGSEGYQANVAPGEGPPVLQALDRIDAAATAPAVRSGRRSATPTAAESDDDEPAKPLAARAQAASVNGNGKHE